MTTPSTRLGIAKPTTADGFNTAEIASNYDLIDRVPGPYHCTSTTRPSWGASHEGMWIYESNTDLYYRWTGAAFVREAPKGLLGSAQAVANATNTTSNLTTVVSAAGIVVPGGRTIQVSGSWYGVSGNPGEIALFRATTRLNTVQLLSGVGGTIIAHEAPAAGTYTYTIQFRTLSTTTTLLASANGPTKLAITEV